MAAEAISTFTAGDENRPGWLALDLLVGCGGPVAGITDEPHRGGHQAVHLDYESQLLGVAPAEGRVARLGTGASFSALDGIAARLETARV